jgi:hypothetical protein
MKATFLLLLPIVLFIGSCKKDDKEPDTPPEPPVDKPAVKLKEMNVRNLPTPYYRFEYNNTGFITHVSFGSGFGMYDVFYDGTRILRMENKNEPNKDILEYEYTNGRLSTINIRNVNGVINRRVVLTVNNSQQLQKLDWEVLQNNGRFVDDWYQEFSYYADGNLKEVTEYFYPVNNQLEYTSTNKYEQYDDKVNADAFSLLNPYQNRHLILLPAFTLQKNNPRRMIRTGDGVDYEVDYSYTYDAANRPLVKTGQVMFTSGSDIGKRFESQSTYSYFD